MENQFKITLVLSLLIFAQAAYSHGEDKPGPNGGFIRMPGAYHTEIVPSGLRKFKIYLLDINWKNPSIKESSVEVLLKNGSQSSKIQCEVKIDFYSCDLPQGKNLKNGKLEVTSKRESQVGNLVTYDLPLKFQKIDDGHGDHH